MSERPPFDPIRAAFYLVAFVLVAEIIVPVAGLFTCWFLASDLILNKQFKCDPDNRLFDLMTSAVAAALGFAAGLMTNRKP